MNCFGKKIEVCFGITRATQGKSQEKLYEELELESLSDRQ